MAARNCIIILEKGGERLFDVCTATGLWVECVIAAIQLSRLQSNIGAWVDVLHDQHSNDASVWVCSLLAQRIYVRGWCVFETFYGWILSMWLWTMNLDAVALHSFLVLTILKRIDKIGHIAAILNI